MRVAVEKIEGVEDARVSLNEGRVTATLAPDNSVTVAQIRAAIRHQGFSPREADIEVFGTIEEGGAVEAGSRVLFVPGSGVRYALEPGPGFEGDLGRPPPGARVTLHGRIAEDRDDVTPSTLTVTAYGVNGVLFGPSP